MVRRSMGVRSATGIFFLFPLFLSRPVVLRERRDLVFRHVQTAAVAAEALHDQRIHTWVCLCA